MAKPLERLKRLAKSVGPGKRVGGEPVDEAEHFMKCRACGQAFDMRDLQQVLYHEDPGHEPKKVN